MNVSYLNTEEFQKKLRSLGRSPKERLIGLSGLINDWNLSKIRLSESDSKKDLSLADIHHLREIIQSEVAKTRLKDAEIVIDQILFLIVGATKMQFQNQSLHPWDLVNQSIDGFFTNDRHRIFKLAALSVISIVIAGALVFKNIHSSPSDNYPGIEFEQNMPSSTINDVSAQTVDHLISIYKQMKNGECQIPQAAMLQEDERESFITFINDGVVDISTADRLKNALKHVNCLYPQDAMKSH